MPALVGASTTSTDLYIHVQAGQVHTAKFPDCSLQLLLLLLLSNGTNGMNATIETKGAFAT